MPKFLGLITLSQSGAADLVDTGLAEHQDFFAHLVEASHGTLEGMWMSNVGDFDLVCIVDLPEGTSAEGAAATLVRRSNGQHTAERWIELVDMTAADSALAKLLPPARAATG
ncbi:MAG: GYD domain-containing protein [Acidimicrobiia bacterium]|nr:GYD domain-containing protein [Acidimicrobiia bacterium]